MTFGYFRFLSTQACPAICAIGTDLRQIQKENSLFKKGSKASIGVNVLEENRDWNKEWPPPFLIRVNPRNSRNSRPPTKSASEAESIETLNSPINQEIDYSKQRPSEFDQIVQELDHCKRNKQDPMACHFYVLHNGNVVL